MIYLYVSLALVDKNKMDSAAWKHYKKTLKFNNITLHETPGYQGSTDNTKNEKSIVVVCGCKRPRFSSSTFEYVDYKKSVTTKYFIMIDVTSGTARKQDRVFSPLVQPSDGSSCVENIWQSCKRYHPDDIPREQEKKFWKEFKTPKNGAKNPRRSKPVANFIAKNKRTPREIRYSFEGTSYKKKKNARRMIYAKAYNRELIQKGARERMQQIKEMLSKSPGQITCVVLDYDGPKIIDAATGMKKSSTQVMTNDFLWKISEGQASFGHGYIVAANIAGIDSSFEKR